MDQQLSPLEQLPEELLWEIVDYALASILSMRLVSKALKENVDKYVGQTRRIRVAEKLQLTGVDVSTMLSIEVPQAKMDLFQLRLKRNGFSPKIISHNRIRGLPNLPLTYRMIISTKVSNELLCRLGECIGGGSATVPAQNRGSIGSLSISACDTTHIIEHIRLLVNGLNFKEISFANTLLEDRHVELLCHLINNNCVEQLDLTVKEIESSDPKSSLLYFSSHLRSMCLSHNQSPNADISPLFGIPDSEWSPLIIEMFAETNNLEKLFLTSFPCMEFLTRDDEDTLKMILPISDKKLWFEAYRDCRSSEVEYVENEYIVKATKTTLEIKHSSRRQNYESKNFCAFTL